jgi:hypothetical protein
MAYLRRGDRSRLRTGFGEKGGDVGDVDASERLPVEAPVVRDLAREEIRPLEHPRWTAIFAGKPGFHDDKAGEFVIEYLDRDLGII